MSKALLQYLIPTIFPVHIFTVLHVKTPYMHMYGTTNIKTKMPCYSLDKVLRDYIINDLCKYSPIGL